MILEYETADGGLWYWPLPSVVWYNIECSSPTKAAPKPLRDSDAVWLILGYEDLFRE